MPPIPMPRRTGACSSGCSAADHGARDPGPAGRPRIGRPARRVRRAAAAAPGPGLGLGLALALLAGLTLTACGGSALLPGWGGDRERIIGLAEARGLRPETIATPLLPVRGWLEPAPGAGTAPASGAGPALVTAPAAGSAGLLAVFIEGDGHAWIDRRRPSADPTPRHPVALELAARSPAPAVAYLARPCQFIAADERAPCSPRLWTDGRFAEEVVASMDAAIDALKCRHAARRLVLIGYSGGAAVALLVGLRRDDVAGVVTVAGTLDHAAWTRHHGVSPLSASLNPADAPAGLARLPQVHFAGREDPIAPPELALAFAAALPQPSAARVVVLDGHGHRCCWGEAWPALEREALAALAALPPRP